MARRRKKRYHPLTYLLPAVLMVVVTLAVIVAATSSTEKVIEKGYDEYVKSTYRLAYYDEVSAACARYGVEESLAYAVIRTESKFNPEAVSTADARGLMQLTDVGLEWIHIRSNEFDDVTKEDLFDPSVNIRCGVYFLSLLQQEFFEDATVAAAYNAGIGVVSEWLENSAYSSDGETLHTIPYPETEAYVKKIISAKEIYNTYYLLDAEPKGES